MSAIDDIRLPPPPRALTGMVRAAGDPDATVSDLGRLAGADPAFAVQLLKLVNSSLYSRGNQISSVRRAAAVMGVHNLRNLALCAAATGKVDVRRLRPFDLNRFWESSLRRAVASEALARLQPELGLSTPDAFTAGLLQDLGVLALIMHDPRSAEVWVDRRGAPPEDRRQTERRLFGCSHDEIGRRLALLWALPPELAAPMQFHHDPEQAPAELQPICRLCGHAELIATVYDADDKRPALEHARRVLGETLTCDAAAIDALIGDVGRRVTTAARNLGLVIPTQPPLEQLLAEAGDAAALEAMSKGELLDRLRRALADTDALRRELSRCRTTIDELTLVDDLTGLPNGRALAGRLNHELRRCARAGDGLAAVLITMAGDTPDPQHEQALAIALGNTLRDTDLAARIGPGRYQLVLTGTTLTGAMVAVRRASGAIASEIPEEAGLVCFGVACVEGKCGDRFDAEDLATRLLDGAAHGSAAAREQDRAVVRTGRETVPWHNATSRLAS